MGTTDLIENQATIIAALRQRLSEVEAERDKAIKVRDEGTALIARYGFAKAEQEIASLRADQERMREALEEYDRIDSCGPATPWCDDPTYGNSDHYDRHPQARAAAIDVIRAALSTPRQP